MTASRTGQPQVSRNAPELVIMSNFRSDDGGSSGSPGQQADSLVRIRSSFLLVESWPRPNPTEHLMEITEQWYVTCTMYGYSIDPDHALVIKFAGPFLHEAATDMFAQSSDHLGSAHLPCPSITNSPRRKNSDLG